MCLSVNRGAEATAETFGKNSIEELNSAINYAKDSEYIRLKYSPLDLATLHIRT